MIEGPTDNMFELWSMGRIMGNIIVGGNSYNATRGTGHCGSYLTREESMYL